MSRHCSKCVWCDLWEEYGEPMDECGLIIPYRPNYRSEHLDWYMEFIDGGKDRHEIAEACPKYEEYPLPDPAELKPSTLAELI